MRILFFGSGHFAVPTLRHLSQHHEIPLVATQPDRPGGRGRHLTPTPVKDFALRSNLRCISVEDINASEAVRELLNLDVQLGVVLAFGQKIGPALLDGIPGGCINAHASLLPKYRGAAPIHWTILSGELNTGVTVFRLVEKMDAGPILCRRRTALNPEETTAELHDRLAGVAVDAVRATLALYQDDTRPPGEVQDESLASQAPKLAKEQGRVRFDQSAFQAARHICAMWSWPGAQCIYRSADGTKSVPLVLVRARPAEGKTIPVSPGEIDARMLVGTSEGMLEILELQPAGGHLMTWPEFVNGRHVRAGDWLE